MARKPVLIGYARVSTDEQSTRAQSDELRSAGCGVVNEEHASGASRSRPVLARTIKLMRPGETLVVVRIDRLARSLSHLLQIIETLEGQGAHFRSLHDPIDTSSPQGKFTLQILGAVAEFERSLIRERTRAGIKAAKAAGRMPGNPKMRTKDPEAIRQLRVLREERYVAEIMASGEEWVPVVRRLRPQVKWSRVVAVVNAELPEGAAPWTLQRLMRAVRRYVKDGLIEAEVLGRAPRPVDRDNVLATVAAIIGRNPRPTILETADIMTSLGVRPRRSKAWSYSSVRNLILEAQSRS